MENLELKDNQPEELLTALYGRREIPFKLEYMGKGGAQAWSNLVEAEEYDLSKNEYDLIQRQAKTIFEKIGKNKVNLVYVGCGTGFKAIPLIKAASKNHSPVALTLLDISPAILEMGKKRISQKIKNNLIMDTVRVDFEGGNFAHITSVLRARFYPNNLLFTLGNTFGNLADRVRILVNFRESMTSTDYLLIGVELAPQTEYEVEKVLLRYKTETDYDLLFNILKNIGVSRNCGKFDLNYNRTKNQLEARFEMTKDRLVRLGTGWVELKKGQKIFLGMSHKFTVSELHKLLNRAGFKTVFLATNKEKTCALIMGKPKLL